MLKKPCTWNVSVADERIWIKINTNTLLLKNTANKKKNPPF